MLTAVVVASAGGGCGDNLAGGVVPTVADAPIAAILAPATGAVIDADTVTVRVRILAEAGLARATVSAAGASVAIDPAALDASGEAEVALALPEGAHELRLVAEDTDQRSALAGAAIIVDTAGPALAIGAPLAGAAETRRLLFAQLTDAVGIESITYAVNGGPAIAVAVTGAPTRATVREALALGPGPNTVELVATDRLGHVRSETIAFRYGLTASAGGSHSGAITAGALATWGRYNVGQLGLGGTLGDAQSRLSPAAVPAFGEPGTEVAAIAFNQNTSVALRSDGTVWTWGANGDGQLGHGDAVQRSVPAQVTAVANIVYVHTGFSHVLALRADGAVLAWGKNAAGQIGVEGNGTATDDQPLPIEVAGIPAPVVEVVAGSEHSLALTVDGRVFAWGRNTFGNLGNGTVDDLRHPVPAEVAGLADVIDLANGRDHVLALRADGSVAAWGLGASGQLGYGVNTDPAGEDRASPVPVLADELGTPLRGVRAVYANGNSSYAIVAGPAGTQQYWGWGQNFNGQLAIGATSSEETLARRAVIYTPGQAPVFLDEVVALASIGAGATHTIARTTTGGVFAWGWNFRGSLGVPAIANQWPQVVAVEVAMP